MPKQVAGVLVPVLLLGTQLFAQAPAPALKIRVLEGEGAINNIRQRSAHAIVVRVEDDDGRPAAGASVVFQVPDLGAGATFADGGLSFTTTTDDRGEAAVRSLRPNNIAGQFQIHVTASHGGETASTVINQTNAAPAVTGGGNRKKFLIAGLAAGAAAGIILGVKGGGSSSSAGSSGTTITPGTPVFGPPR